MVVSFNASAVRLSHVDANAGTAVRHARTNIAHFIVGIFIWASELTGVYTGSIRLESQGPVLTLMAANMVAPMKKAAKASPSDLQYPRLFVARSKIHGLGLFAGEDIEWGRRLIEYQGQRVSNKEVKRRQRFYDSIGFTCLMQFSNGRAIDGVVGGNESRFINHSTKANVGALREGAWRIVFYSLDEIAKGEELTFNYGFDPKRISLG